MIPKIIHYCWLSDDPIPEKLQYCMNTWKEKLYDYEFFLWNFDRFDINSSLWVKQAFENKKYAYAADYIRLFAVYHYGGIYLDMDVEIIKSFNDLLNRDIMLGYEDDYKNIEAACFGAEKHHPFIKQCIEYYENRSFYKSNGELDTKLTLPTILMMIYKKYDSLKISKNSLSIYSSSYFSAKDYSTGITRITENTYSIHHFSGSWLSEKEKKLTQETWDFYKKYENDNFVINLIKINEEYKARIENYEKNFFENISLKVLFKKVFIKTIKKILRKK